MGAIFDACRAISAVPRSAMPSLPRDKSRGIRQGDDFACARFRSRKNPRQTFTVQAGCVSDMGIYRSKLGDMRMAEKLPVPENRNICRLSLRYGQYHMSVPYDEKLPPRAREPSAGGGSRPGSALVPDMVLCRLRRQDRRGSVFQDTEALREAGRAAEPCREVTGKKATGICVVLPAGCGIRVENLVMGASQAGSAVPGGQLRCDTASNFRDIGDGGAWQAQDQVKDRAQPAESGTLQIQAFHQEQGSRDRSDSAGRKRGPTRPRQYPGPERCWRTSAVRRWWLVRTVTGWTVTTMERVGSTCVRWEISPL